jgi:hypothetical protein
MPLFDEVLSEGSSFGKLALERELHTRIDAFNRQGRAGEYLYRGAGDLLIQHGSYYTGRALPEQYRHLKGEQRECFWNSLGACEADPTLRYVEGVFSSGAGVYTTHAWCIDPAGELLDVTMPTWDLSRYVDGLTGMGFMPVEKWSYWGCIFDTELVRWHSDNLGMPMLDRGAADKRFHGYIDVDEEHDWPILKVPYDPKRKSL